MIISKTPNIGLAVAFIAMTFIFAAIAFVIGEFVAKIYLKFTKKEDSSYSMSPLPKTDKVTSASDIENHANNNKEVTQYTKEKSKCKSKKQ